MGVIGCCHLFLLIVIDAASVTGNWLLYKDLLTNYSDLTCNTFEGQSLKNALLAFSIITTVLALFEIFNLYRKIYHEESLIHVDLASAITVWLEHVPHTIINIFLAICLKDRRSVYQIVKAILIIIVSFLRVVVLPCYYCCCRTSEEDRETSNRLYRASVILGNIFVFAGSIYILKVIV